MTKPKAVKRPRRKPQLNGSPIAGPSTRTPIEQSQHLIRSICVYCGSGKGENAAYAKAARVLGKSLGDAGLTLVYGGGGLGLMGEVARSTLKHGGKVTGIIPTFLSNRERMLEEVNELIITDDMHQRKMAMFTRSDAFVALPGGIGTLEELVEQMTWSQLGRHKKPIIVANIEGFWSPFLALLDHMRGQSFIRPGLDVTFTVVDRAQDIVPAAIEVARTIERMSDESVVARF